MKRGKFTSLLIKMVALSGLFALLFTCSLQQEQTANSVSPIGIN